MILSKDQAVACAYAMDTSELCAHLTIGADIDVQKLPRGQVSVEARDASEYYPNVAAFVEAYGAPVSSHPLAALRQNWKEQADADRVGKIVTRTLVGVGILAIIFGVGHACLL